MTDSLRHLIRATYGVRKKLSTLNIKTCQLMIDLLMYEQPGEDKPGCYQNNELSFILNNYLEKEDFETVNKEEFTKMDLVAILHELSDHYRDKGRGTRALRLLELAAEFAFDKEGIEKMLQRYISRKADKNALLTRKTHALFS